MIDKVSFEAGDDDVCKYDEYIAGRKRYLDSLEAEQLTKWLSVAKTDDDIKEWSYEEKLSVFTKEEIKTVLDVKLNNMEMFAIYGGGDPESTQFEYEIGEIINVNSNIEMMCKKKEIVNGKLYQFFKRGRIVFD